MIRNMIEGQRKLWTLFPITLCGFWILYLLAALVCFVFQEWLAGIAFLFVAEAGMHLSSLTVARSPWHAAKKSLEGTKGE